MISLKQLKYALAVKETKHFKQAAELCHVSQSALSTAVQELESQLGVQLFERDNKKVLITPLGERILDQALNVMTQINDIEQMAQTHSEPLTHPMSIGIIPTIGPYLLPKVLPALRAKHPNFELTLVEDQSAVLLDALKRGSLDAAILALPYDVTGLLSFEFWAEDFYAITHINNPIASLTSVGHSDLQATPLLLLKEGHCLTDQALAVCQLPRPQTDTGLGGTSLYTLVQMVAGKMGTTFVPQMALSSVLEQNPELKAARINEPGPHRQIAFVVRPNYVNMKSIDELRALFKQSLQAEL